MAETSAIEWCDATVNFWWGCTKVSPGCDHCYAETWNKFRGTGEWGPNAPRRKIKGAVALLRKLNQKSPITFFNAHGRSIRVFMQSMSDTFDNEVDDAWRAELFAEAADARWVNIILLTKRGANVAKMVPASWIDNWPKHIGLMFSVTSQREADRDIPRLIDLKLRLGLPWIGLSLEPLLERTRLKAEWLDHIDWVIVGGESGPDARPMHPEWLDDIKNACTLRNYPRKPVPFLFKQWGEWVPHDVAVRLPKIKALEIYPSMELRRDGNPFSVTNLGTVTMVRVGKKAAGREMYGTEYLQFPKALS
ncbi:DUF5131 family protein [Rhizobium skierniewicense]|uniref:DUF5131 family protein n=1 Tax=Rhizobium skierniewicense TaxID=984260 RepID=UPI001FAC4666|nr:DUF5131 family protein [Rhizobium skierniewicense]MCI9865557.1 DUF5131 family protein [Rhizobium skierniewicense]